MGTNEMVIVLILIVLPLAGIFDLMRQSALKKNKTLWGLIILLVPLVGPTIYLISTRYIYLVKKD